MNVPSADLLEISVAVDGEAAEAICALFEQYGGGAVVEERFVDGSDGRSAGAGGDSVAGSGPAAPTRTSWVRTYLPVDDVDARRRVEVGLWHLGQIYPIPEPLVHTIAEANWAEAWKAHFSPIAVGAGFWIIPAWVDPADVPAAAGGRVIRLDPGMAFGTGLHPTTQLCLAALEACVRPGAAVLDVGTGSGILAIGAAGLGAANVVGIDIDAKAVEIAAANAALNGARLQLRAGTIEAAGDAVFDVVVANILAGTLIDLAGPLAARVRPGGRLIGSGILADQAPGVAAAFAAAGLVPSGEELSGDWVAITAERPDDG